MANLIRLIRRQGIAWIKGINWDFSVKNMSNEDELRKYKLRLVMINLLVDEGTKMTYNYHFAYDRDFCLFIDFPFQQLVYFHPTFGFLEIYPKHVFANKSSSILSCTEQWLTQYFNVIKKHIKPYVAIFWRIDDLEFTTTCDFARRIDLCKRNHFLLNYIRDISLNKFVLFDFMLVFELLVIILTPLLGAFGILTNSVSIYIILHEKNKKTMREKHYIYISLHCVSNLIICFIQIIQLMSECQYPFGFYCSSIRMIIPIQYIKIIFEYLNNVCRLVSNFTYFGFSICRMSRIGKDHGNFIKFMNDLTIKKYIAVCLFFSFGISVCKILQFNINLESQSAAYPFIFIQNEYQNKWFFQPGYVAIMIINAIYDILNYFIFVIIHLSVDIVLVRKLKRVIQEKEAKMIEMKSSVKDLEKARKENEESKRRAIFMVVFNSVFNFLTKVPSIVTSMNDVRVLFLNIFNNNHFNQNFDFNLTKGLTFRYFCVKEKSCLIFQSLSNSLFLVSLDSVLFFLKAFDNNFKAAYKIALKRHKSKQVKK